MGRRSRSREKETRSLCLLPPAATSAAARSSPDDLEIPAVGASDVVELEEGLVPVIRRAPPGPVLATRRAEAPAAAALAALTEKGHLPLHAKTTAPEAEGKLETLAFPFLSGRQASTGSAATRAQSPEAEEASAVSGGRPATVPTPLEERRSPPEALPVAGGENTAATARCALRAWLAPAAPPDTAATRSSPGTFSRLTSSLSGDPSKGSVSAAATARQFFATAGLGSVPIALPSAEAAAPTSPAPALPAATTGRKVGFSHAKRSKSAAMSS